MADRKSKADADDTDSEQTRHPPLHIPLDFETAVDGLLQVNPKQPVESKREPGKPAPRKKKPGTQPGK